MDDSDDEDPWTLGCHAQVQGGPIQVISTVFPSFRCDAAHKLASIPKCSMSVNLPHYPLLWIQHADLLWCNVRYLSIFQSGPKNGLFFDGISWNRSMMWSDPTNLRWSWTRHWQFCPTSNCPVDASWRRWNGSMQCGNFRGASTSSRLLNLQKGVRGFCDFVPHVFPWCIICIIYRTSLTRCFASTMVSRQWRWLRLHVWLIERGKDGPL